MPAASTPRRVVVIDDDTSLNEMLCTALEFAGYEVRGARTMAEGLEVIATATADVIVLDVNLPDGDGFELCERLRRRGDRTPVIFLTARESNEDVMRGLRLGGDDYVTKPFHLGELSLRIEAILRRAAPPEVRELRYGSLCVNTDRHEVLLDSRPVHLTPREFAVLHHLIVNADRVISRGQIAEAIVGASGVDDDRLVETYISRIRSKLGESARLLQTVRGVGYTLRRESP